MYGDAAVVVQVMGRSHALSGAVGWVGACTVLAEVGHRPSWSTVVIGAAVSTGFALVPDVDHPGSTVSRTLGPASRLLSGVVAGGAVRVRRASCRHCTTRPDSGHRGLTHTGLGALAAGIVLGLLGWWLGERVGLAVVGFAVWLALHTALSSRTRARIGDMVLPGRFRRHGRVAHRFTASVGALMVAGLFTAGTAVETPAGGWWWIGVPVAWGCLAHILGDALTFSAVPLLWPLQIRGCRWAAVGPPRWMRFRTGSRVESVVVVGMALVGAASAWLLAV